ncbi:hypothetical protein D9C73_028269 [Collichthys lucidus]|uniref:Uncharacterized protein n=1 Tax=Collichthys lucidus TaxID=240159 RepID=A0A4U5TW34_COLLU|nr:hypothetical protein D9C73_028269 [Collichthys lucidus]
MLFEGAWENQGLGIVKSVGAELVGPTPLPTWATGSLPRYPRQTITWDMKARGISCHTTPTADGNSGRNAGYRGWISSLLLCHCGSSHRQPRRRRRARFSKLTVVKKDQTTSTHMEEGLLFRSGDNSLASCSVQCDPSSTPRHKANYNIYVEDPGSRPAAPFYENIAPDRTKGSQPPSLYINSEEVARLREKAEQNRANMNSDNFFQDKLVHIYNQPVAHSGTRTFQCSGAAAVRLQVCYFPPQWS